MEAWGACLGLAIVGIHLAALAIVPRARDPIFPGAELTLSEEYKEPNRLSEN